MSDNGTLAASNTEVTLSPAVLRRVARLHARAEGAQFAVQAATQAQQAAAQAVREALNEACEEQGVILPDGSAPVDIDWRTGVLKIGPPEQGAPPPALVGPAAGPQF